MKGYLSADSDKNHAKLKFLSTWWSTDYSKNYTVGRSMDLLFSPNLFFLISFALLRKSGLYFSTTILTFSLNTLVNVYVDLVVFTRIAGTS